MEASERSWLEELHPLDGSWGGTLVTASVLHHARPYWSRGVRGKYAVTPEVPGRAGGTHLCWFPSDDSYLTCCPLCQKAADGVTHYAAYHRGLVDADGLVLELPEPNGDNRALFVVKSLAEYRGTAASIRADRERVAERMGGTVVWPHLPDFEPELAGRERQKPRDHLDALMRNVPLPGRVRRDDWLWETVWETGLTRRQVVAWCQAFRNRSKRTFKGRGLRL